MWKKEPRRLQDLRAEINQYQDQINSKPELKQEAEPRQQQVSEESVPATGGATATQVLKKL